MFFRSNNIPSAPLLYSGCTLTEVITINKRDGTFSSLLQTLTLRFLVPSTHFQQRPMFFRFYFLPSPPPAPISLFVRVFGAGKGGEALSSRFSI